MSIPNPHIFPFQSLCLMAERFDFNYNLLFRIISIDVKEGYLTEGAEGSACQGHWLQKRSILPRWNC